MKVAFTTNGNNLNARLDPRFGRAPNFLIFDTETNMSHIVENTQNLNAAQGAGIQSATHLAKEKVDCIVTGNCGPKAFATLSAAGIRIYTSSASTVREALGLFERDELDVAQSANVEGHWV